MKARKMMKRLFMIAILFLLSAEVQASVLGIPDGIYEGDGILISQTPFVPNLSFHSVRQISGDTITVQTTAGKFGVVLAKATARLQVVFQASNKFVMINLDTGNIAGHGVCTSASEGCRFTVGVMPNSAGVPDLTLTESWVPDANGFIVQEGSQNFKNKAATYEGMFKLINY